jgi:hypothetical protein
VWLSCYISYSCEFLTMFHLSLCSVSDFHNSKHNTNARVDDRTSMLLIEIIRGLSIGTKKV